MSGLNMTSLWGEGGAALEECRGLPSSGASFLATRNVFDDGDYKLLFSSETFRPVQSRNPPPRSLLTPPGHNKWVLQRRLYTSISLNFFSYCFLRPPIKSGDFFKIGFWAENENLKSIAKLNFVFFFWIQIKCDSVTKKISDPAEQQRPMHKWVPLKSNRCIAVIVRLAHSTPLGSLPKEK